ncbi:F-box protein SKIP24 [Phalaenopsis equestris]|uniref:F-box protein SKIP24 n=1 Tax=Phalaenopsis equestris TaxID=78828 RepID=UPI0009E45871|nr:F-box protein SKIP24 [Phalaenopsis equestris]
MWFLPDEIWIKILDMGAATKRLSCRDLCSLAVTCRRHNRLSNDPSIWSILLALDFPQPISSSSSSPEIPSKSLYRIRFERDKARRITAWKRGILIAESQVSACRERLEEVKLQLRKEGERMKAALEELGSLERIRQASVALNIWQPELVRGSQRQLVEQCFVPIEYRLSNLKMEVDCCKLQIITYKNAFKEQKRRLEESEVFLSRQKHNPLEIYFSGVSGKDSGAKRKRLTK